MPKGPRGEKRPADVIGAAVMVAKIAVRRLGMRRRSAGIAMALLLCASTLGLAQTAMTADEAKKKIAAAGYWMIEDIKPTGDGGYTAFAMKGDDMLGVKVSKDGKVEPEK